MQTNEENTEIKMIEVYLMAKVAVIPMVGI